MRNLFEIALGAVVICGPIYLLVAFGGPVLIQWFEGTAFGEPARTCQSIIDFHNDYGYELDGFFVTYSKHEKSSQVSFKALRLNKYGAWQKGEAECRFSVYKDNIKLTSAKSHGSTYQVPGQ